ncbi:MAG: 50S ribosomal protein L22 [Solirubrobacteraceae bacterium]
MSPDDLTPSEDAETEADSGGTAAGSAAESVPQEAQVPPASVPDSASAEDEGAGETAPSAESSQAPDAESAGAEEAEEPAPKRRRRRKAATDEPVVAETADPGPASASAAAEDEEPEAEEDEGEPEAEDDVEDEGEQEAEDDVEGEPEAEGPVDAPRARPRRRGELDPDLPPPVVRAQAKYVRSSARKARLVCDNIRGKSVQDARAILALTPRVIARDWSKLLESAVANAEHNHELVGEDLFVMAIHADEGPTIKRFRPRARGRAAKIRKRTSHLTILLTPKD